jgi:hypothetical protein
VQATTTRPKVTATADVGADADLSAHAKEDHFGALGGPPRSTLPAHSMSAAAEIRTPPSGSRRDGSSPRAMSALTQGTVRPSQRAASGCGVPEVGSGVADQR